MGHPKEKCIEQNGKALQKNINSKKIKNLFMLRDSNYEKLKPKKMNCVN